MFQNDYISSAFCDYLNRNLKGIFIFKDKLQKVALTYELSESFSNHTCRLSIEVELGEFDRLSMDEKAVAHKCFYNSSDSSGSRFVSFNYKPQRSNWIDFEQIKSFMLHYEFASEIFEGIVKQSLPNGCVFERSTLDDEPLFNYTKAFLKHLKYSDDEIELEKKYKMLYGRSFEFDCSYHSRLKEASITFQQHSFKEPVSDKQLVEAKACNYSDLRLLVIENKIPFQIYNYRSIIDEIIIDGDQLYLLMESYQPSTYEVVRPDVIRRVLDGKKTLELQRQIMIDTLSEQAGFSIGDYIFVERDYWKADFNYVGIVQKLTTNYNNELVVEYVMVNQNLKISKRDSKTTIVDFIQYSLSGLEVEENIRSRNFSNRDLLIRLMLKQGKKNPKYKKLRKINE